MLLLKRLAQDAALTGAVVTIDATACKATVAGTARKAGADYSLGSKADQPTLHKKIQSIFADAPKASLERSETQVDKGAGRIEARYCITSAKFDAQATSEAMRDHWAIENQLHWLLDGVFDENQSRLRKNHGAKTWQSSATSPLTTSGIPENPSNRNEPERTRFAPQDQQTALTKARQHQTPLKTRRIGYSISTGHPQS